MKIYKLPPVALSLLLLLSLPGQAAPPSHRQVLPQVVDAPHVFNTPLPASRPVSADWFSDAVFIGDARLGELLNAGLFQPALALTQIGLNVRDVRSGSLFSLDGQRATLRQMLEGTQWKKVYLMLGFNEAAWMDDQEFYEEYSALIDDLRALLPGAQIYLQTLIPVTVSRAVAQVPDNRLLANRSALLTRLARSQRVYLVAVDAFFTEANGTLSPGLSTDGLHLTAEGNARWFEYLRTHTMGS